VACFGPLVVFVWRLVKHISICCVASLIVCPMHGVILIFARVAAKSVHPSLLIDVVGSCIYFYGITHNCWIALEADFTDISITLKGIKVCWTAVFSSCVIFELFGLKFTSSRGMG